MKFDDNLSSVSLVVTSCKRHDLLYKTLSSFVKYNTYPIQQIIVIEDSDVFLSEDDIKAIFFNVKKPLYIKTEIIIVNNKCNLGQMASIDKAYGLVTSEYIFHCEDDWCFYRSSFIEESISILSADENIFTVWLRAYNDLNGHTVSDTINSSKISYRRINPMGLWSGFTLNPGLRLTKNCLRFGAYTQQDKLDTSVRNKDKVAESDLAILYAQHDFIGAVTIYPDGFVRHSGFGRHISNHWENNLIVAIKNFVKRVLRKNENQ